MIPHKEKIIKSNVQDDHCLLRTIEEGASHPARRGKNAEAFLNAAVYRGGDHLTLRYDETGDLLPQSKSAGRTHFVSRRHFMKFLHAFLLKMQLRMDRYSQITRLIATIALLSARLSCVMPQALPFASTIYPFPS